jgi:hypothetical protein
MVSTMCITSRGMYMSSGQIITATVTALPRSLPTSLHRLNFAAVHSVVSDVILPIFTAANHRSTRDSLHCGQRTSLSYKHVPSLRTVTCKISNCSRDQNRPHAVCQEGIPHSVKRLIRKCIPSFDDFAKVAVSNSIDRD